MEYSASVICLELGERLRQARLNLNLSQAEVANLAGLTRKMIVQAEKGKVQLEVFVAIMIALNLTDQLSLFLPKQPISPIALAKLQGKQRQRASRQTGTHTIEDDSTW